MRCTTPLLLLAPLLAGACSHRPPEHVVTCNAATLSHASRDLWVVSPHDSVRIQLSRGTLLTSLRFLATARYPADPLTRASLLARGREQGWIDLGFVPRYADGWLGALAGDALETGQAYVTWDSSSVPFALIHIDTALIACRARGYDSKSLYSLLIAGTADTLLSFHLGEQISHRAH